MALLEVVFLLIFWSWVACAALLLRNTFLPRMPLTQSPQLLQLASETVQFQATDGMRLEGWTIRAGPNHPWIILCHGIGSNRADLLDIAAGLHAAGFNVFLFDFRGHGGSAGRVTSFGWQEQRDLEGALAFLGRQSDVRLMPYGIYGISMGGAVALMVAAQDERLGAVAVDSPYTTLEESLARHMKLLYPQIPRMPFLGFVLSTYRLRFGVWPRDVSPLESIGKLNPRAVLLIQGGRDNRMPVEGARRLLARAGEPKQLWIVEGAGHLESYGMDPARYLEGLVGFFEQRLGGGA